MSLKSIKTTRKKKTRAPRVKVNKLAVPQWEGWEEWTGEQFHRHKRSASDWYYQSFKPADLHPHLYQWMLEQKEYSKTDVQAIKALPSHRISSIICINAKLLLDGMPNYNKKEDEYWQSLAGTMGTTKPVTEWMTKNIKELIEEGSSIVKEKKAEEKQKVNVYVPTIQERIRDQAYKQAEALEEWLEGWITDPKSFDPKGFDFKKHFQEYGVTQAHAR